MRRNLCYNVFTVRKNARKKRRLSSKRERRQTAVYITMKRFCLILASARQIIHHTSDTRIYDYEVTFFIIPSASRRKAHNHFGVRSLRRWLPNG